jgi:DNA/RNA-binding domain of Phe-tRNA-synthetase-like protein
MSKVKILINNDFISTYPNAFVGFLQFKIEYDHLSLGNLLSSTLQITGKLKNQFVNPSDLRSDSVIQAYVNYYKSFRKSYHVLLQLESLLYGGKHSLPMDPLLRIIFLAELKNRLLTAVHQTAMLEYPLSVGIATGQEQYTLLNGSMTFLKQGDMVISDQMGVISSIIYGPDFRTRIRAGTNRALVAVYAPAGIDRQLVEAHFSDIISLADAASLKPIIEFQKFLPD